MGVVDSLFAMNRARHFERGAKCLGYAEAMHASGDFGPAARLYHEARGAMFSAVVGPGDPNVPNASRIKHTAENGLDACFKQVEARGENVQVAFEPPLYGVLHSPEFLTEWYYRRQQGETVPWPENSEIDAVMRQRRVEQRELERKEKAEAERREIEEYERESPRLFQKRWAELMRLARTNLEENPDSFSTAVGLWRQPDDGPRWQDGWSEYARAQLGGLLKSNPSLAAAMSPVLAKIGLAAEYLDLKYHWAAVGFIAIAYPVSALYLIVLAAILPKDVESILLWLVLLIPALLGLIAVLVRFVATYLSIPAVIVYSLFIALYVLPRRRAYLKAAETHRLDMIPDKYLFAHGGGSSVRPKKTA